MNVLVISSKRKGFVTSIEDKTVAEGETFTSKFSTDSRFFNVHDVVCSDAVFDVVDSVAGSLTSPKIVESATDPNEDPNRLNLYIEDGELKVA
jgi:hypothetical protein